MSMMKIRLISATLMLFCSTIGYACDNPVGEKVYTLQPGQTQTVQWDFTNCWFGINSWTIYVTNLGTRTASRHLCRQILL